MWLLFTSIFFFLLLETINTLLCFDCESCTILLQKKSDDNEGDPFAVFNSKAINITTCGKEEVCSYEDFAGQIVRACKKESECKLKDNCFEDQCCCNTNLCNLKPPKPKFRCYQGRTRVNEDPSVFLQTVPCYTRCYRKTSSWVEYDCVLPNKCKIDGCVWSLVWNYKEETCCCTGDLCNAGDLKEKSELFYEDSYEVDTFEDIMEGATAENATSSTPKVEEITEWTAPAVTTMVSITGNTPSTITPQIKTAEGNILSTTNDVETEQITETAPATTTESTADGFVELPTNGLEENTLKEEAFILRAHRK